MPDANPRFNKLPRPESIDAFIRYVRGSNVVVDVRKVHDQLIAVERLNGPSIRVHMTNVYIVGLADVAEILAEENTIDAIVTLSGWNSYSTEAKEYCKDNNIGLFKFKEFLGAVHYNNNQFFNYIHPDDR